MYGCRLLAPVILAGMGQEQSLQGQEGAQNSRGQGGGIRVVRSGAVVDSSTRNDLLVREVNSLPMPFPVLPPPPVPDDVTSALTGGAMIHEIRSALGGIRLPGTPAPAPSPPPSAPPKPPRAAAQPKSTASAAAAAVSAAAPEPADISGTPSDGDLSREEAENDAIREDIDVSKGQMSEEEAARWAQGRWARVVMDVTAVQHAVDGASGGEPLARVLDEQERLAGLVHDARAGAERVLRAMDATEKEASRTRHALEALERLRMAAADVQDGLEAAAATVNILGASHFADDPEMCSFKAYLARHPPDYGDDNLSDLNSGVTIQKQAFN
jgi:hypothetical protein